MARTQGVWTVDATKGTRRNLGRQHQTCVCACACAQVYVGPRAVLLCAAHHTAGRCRFCWKSVAVLKAYHMQRHQLCGMHVCVSVCRLCLCVSERVLESHLAGPRVMRPGLHAVLQHAPRFAACPAPGSSCCCQRRAACGGGQPAGGEGCWCGTQRVNTHTQLLLIKHCRYP